MLLLYGDEQTLDEAERDAGYREAAQLVRQGAANGQYVAATPLYPSWTATSVRVRDGKRLVSDGACGETREQLGGFVLIDAPDLDEAIALAGQLALARCGTVEIRPVRESP